MLKRKLRHQRGLSLIELMVAMVVGLLIIAAAGTSYIVSSRSSRDTINAARLNMELRGAMSIMVDEIRRAGANGNLTTIGVNNPFTNQTAGSRTDITITDNCIEFTYDVDADGVVDGDEYLGFRVVNGLIETRTSGTTNDCTSGASDSWLGLTDSNTMTTQPVGGLPYFAITFQCLNTFNNNKQDVSCNNYDFTGLTAGSIGDMLETRTVTINLGGQLVQDPNMQMQLTQEVHVRNHRVTVGNAP